MSEENKKEYPSLFQQAKNLSKFGWDMMQYVIQNEDRVLFVTDEVFRDRMTICKACDRYDDLQNRCTECGCYLNQKARMILDGCPLGKWNPDQEGWEKRFGEMMKDMEEPQEDTKNQ